MFLIILHIWLISRLQSTVLVGRHLSKIAIVKDYDDLLPEIFVYAFPTGSGEYV